MATRIPAFLDGNTFVHFNEYTDRLFGSNSGGLIKIFDPETDTEPISIDIPENITSLAVHGEKVLVTTSAGELALLKVSPNSSGDEPAQIIFKGEKSLRDVVFVNEGNRSICGGDASSLVIIDYLDGNNVLELKLPSNPAGLAYNASAEMVAVSLSSGDVHIYSVINQEPVKVHAITDILPKSPGSSVGSAVRCLWGNNGEFLFVPTSEGSVTTYLRSDWSTVSVFKDSSSGGSNSSGSSLVSITHSPSLTLLALLYKDGTIDVYNVKTAQKIQSLEKCISAGAATNIAWTSLSIFVGATSGELYSHPASFREPEVVISKDVELLFLDEAEDTDFEQETDQPASKKHSLDDSNIIDEDEDEETDEQIIHNGESYDYYNKSVDDILYSRKKQKRSEKSVTFSTPNVQTIKQIVPFSPGSTPWIQSNPSTNNASKRRYLFMSSIGYTWSIGSTVPGTSENQKSITVSFFDRSTNKDYHFVDYNNYDLCSMNERGILLGCSGFDAEQTALKGKISYRHHSTTNDSWERQVPLVKEEYLTSISLTSSADPEYGESLIVVGTSLGYLRFFNLHGLCTNLMKTAPIVASIASLLDTVFVVHRSGNNHYSYSLINVAEDYSFMQQEKLLPLIESDKPLIKGLFFNEYSDPCIVTGNDDALTILAQWREPNNARWIPILNCKDIVTDYGLAKTKENWSCWPLGFQDEKFVAMVLKTTDSYPGFPLPLPVDFAVRMPVKCFRSLVEQNEHNEEEEEFEAKLAKIQEEDPEEEFLRASTFGKLLSSSIADLDNDEEVVEKLNGFSVTFDKSLLKLFNNACQGSRLNKAFSIVKLIKNDKALLAATRIGERHNFNNLVAKINKLREDLMDLEEES